MKKFKFKKIDAFATTGSEGNPAGYIHLTSQGEINEAEMQHIAKELKGFVNEVGYIHSINDNDEFALKYYSSEREVDFCGHATIAILYDLIKNDPHLAQLKRINIQTKKGKLMVENRIASEDAVFIMSPLPTDKTVEVTVSEIAQALNINEAQLNEQLPVQIINAGLNTLIVPVKSLTAILSIAPQLESLKAFCLRAGVDIIEVFTDEVSHSSHDYRVRVFAPTFGYLEDPATGSGNAALGYYLIGLGTWNTEQLIIEQNSQKKNYNVIKLQKGKDEHGNERILFGGSATTRITGDYSIY